MASNGDTMASRASETSPLLAKPIRTSSTLSSGSGSGADTLTDHTPASVQPPVIPYLIWIETALFANVFLAGFDGTVTASTYAVITSEFHSANMASWISTSYLVATTALQPLYGRLSDIFGRRICLLSATTFFGLGCLGCALSPDLPTLIVMRALTGAGGAGLMTMATIINTDLIAPDQRGMYQAVQNILHGMGAILGASLGGTIASVVGWRFAFLLQVPICLAALTIAHTVVPAKIVPLYNHKEALKPADTVDDVADILPGALSNALADPMLEEVVAGDDIASVEAARTKRSAWEQVDFLGAFLLIVGLSMLLAALSAGSNEQSWTNPIVLGCIATSFVVLGAFVVVEAHTKAVPLLPLSMLHGSERAALLVANVCLGVAGYGFLFLMPLFFQSVLLDSASVSGLRLVASSLATPMGGLLTGVAMKHFANHPRFGDTVLALIARAGAVVMMIGALVNLSLGMHDASWKYSVFLMCSSFGLGMSFPSGLFIFIGSCDFSEHAVATYLVYLVRSIGAVCGVAAISTIVQTNLAARLTAAFAGTPGGDELIETLTHSVEALHDLDDETRQLVQAMYYGACRMAMCFLLGTSTLNVICNFLTSTKRRM
ncbi:mfs transporter [Ophiostoma piceae UAMH 11346]|uniref:Mfs transporter n=1 Tax=Ophiostoma piceae (strain UAMH 11346) TaxID=1262450 RepID=S3BUD2_OPHP1|nr:mfs transporter [Ophiostoma piceae UAMH 11346]